MEGNRGRPVRRVWPRPAVLSLHHRTGHRGLKSMTEELGGSELSTGEECLTFQGEALLDSVLLRPLWSPPTHSVLDVFTLYLSLF